MGGDGVDASAELVVGGREARRPPSGATTRVAAIIHVHNDGDILPEVIGHLAAQGLSVHVFDNWSTDGSWEAAQRLVDRGLVSHLEQFPASGPPSRARRKIFVDRASRHAGERSALDASVSR